MVLKRLRTKRASKNNEIETPAAVAPTRVVVVRPAVKRRSFSERAFGLFTLLVIPGFLLASSIPALAAGNSAFGDDVPVVLAAPKSVTEGQTVSASTAVVATVTRGAFTADTHAQVVARQAAVARAGSYSIVKPQQEGDDYPWRAASGGLSPLGYVARQCTDFVAWRINRDQGSTGAPFKWVWGNLTPGGGSASRWASAWNAHGWQTSNTPVPGAVAWFNGNHIAYVKAVNGDGTVFLEEYNWGGDASYHTRTIAASSVALFLYPPG